VAVLHQKVEHVEGIIAATLQDVSEEMRETRTDTTRQAATQAIDYQTSHTQQAGDGVLPRNAKTHNTGGGRGYLQLTTLANIVHTNEKSLAVSGWLVSCHG
jgi:hypothetical protein